MREVGKVTLGNMVNRLNFDLCALAAHPGQEEMLEKRIKEDKNLIIKACLDNVSNPLFEQIVL